MALAPFLVPSKMRDIIFARNMNMTLIIASQIPLNSTENNGPGNHV